MEIILDLKTDRESRYRADCKHVYRQIILVIKVQVYGTWEMIQADRSL
jgi:hypothetical protein